MATPEADASTEAAPVPDSTPAETTPANEPTVAVPARTPADNASPGTNQDGALPTEYTSALRSAEDYLDVFPCLKPASTIS